MLPKITSFLAHLSPSAPALVGNALAVLSVFVAVYTIRKQAPSVWLFVTKWIPGVDKLDVSGFSAMLIKLAQSLPGQLLGVALAAATSGGKAALPGLLWGVGAAALHEILAWSPLPYKGAVAKPEPPGDDGSGGAGAEVIHITIPPEGRIPSNPPPAALRSLLLACVVLACSPAATQKAEAAGAAAAECLANPAVKACLVGLTCEGPDKACAAAKLAYAAGCLDLCRAPADAGADQ